MDKDKRFNDFLLAMLSMLYLSEDFQEFKKNFSQWIWIKYFQANGNNLSQKSLDKLLTTKLDK